MRTDLCVIETDSFDSRGFALNIFICFHQNKAKYLQNTCKIKIKWTNAKSDAENNAKVTLPINPLVRRFGRVGLGRSRDCFLQSVILSFSLHRNPILWVQIELFEYNRHRIQHLRRQLQRRPRPWRRWMDGDQIPIAIQPVGYNPHTS